MHPVDVFGGVAFGGEIGFDGLVHDGDEGDDVAQGDIGRGADVVGLILFEAGVTECDLLLIVDPVLIVGAQAGVEDPIQCWSSACRVL